MSKYHLGKHGAPLCKTRGSGNRWNVVVLQEKEWMLLEDERRCSKCAKAHAAMIEKKA